MSSSWQAVGKDNRLELNAWEWACFIVQDTNGQIHHWHATSEMHLGMTKEEGNEIYAVDFHPIGVKFATAGLDS